MSPNDSQSAKTIVAGEQSAKSQDPPPSIWKNIGSYLLDQWLIFSLGLAILIAWAWPNGGKDGGAIRAEYTVKYGAIAIIFLITGLSLSTKALINQALSFRLHAVTQIISFLCFSSLAYGIVRIIIASGNTNLDRVVLGGIITMACLPTTLASNVAMTRNAGGNVESATAEVVVGNVLGTFITPLLLELYLKPLKSRGFIQPEASAGSGLVGIYIHMAKTLSIILFAPLIVGQIVQNIFPKKTVYYRELLRLNIISQIFLVILVWSTFCNQFAAGIFKRVSKETIILVAFLNVGLYVFMTGVCLVAARPPFSLNPSKLQDKKRTPIIRLRVLLSWLRFDKKVTAAICFCGAAKGLVLGAPLVSIMYSAYELDIRAGVTLPIALYQGTQIAIAQFSVTLVKRWIEQGEDEDKVTSLPAKKASNTELDVEKAEKVEKAT